MSLSKPIHKMSVLIPYEQLLIQTFHHNGNLITEQGTGEQIPLTLRLLMSSIYMEHLFLMFPDHTQRRTTVGRTPLDE